MTKRERRRVASRFVWSKVQEYQFIFGTVFIVGCLIARIGMILPTNLVGILIFEFGFVISGFAIAIPIITASDRYLLAGRYSKDEKTSANRQTVLRRATAEAAKWAEDRNRAVCYMVLERDLTVEKAQEIADAVVADLQMEYQQEDFERSLVFLEALANDKG